MKARKWERSYSSKIIRDRTAGRPGNGRPYEVIFIVSGRRWRRV